MTEKRFELIDDYAIGYDGDIFDLHKPSNIRSLVTVIGYVTEENEQLKQQLKEEQLRTTPITLTTHISDEDFERLEKLLKKHFGGDV